MLTHRDKIIAKLFRDAFTAQRKRAAIAPWRFGNRGVSYGEMNNLTIAGFAYLVPASGVFVPCLDLLASPKSVVVTHGAAVILRRMLSGDDLHRINKSGYITSPDDPARWTMHTQGGVRIRIAEADADLLWTLGLIECDGCGHGWPFQWTSRQRINIRRLAGVNGFRALSMRQLKRRLRPPVAEPEAGGE
jgi:hypothetical protein